MHKILVPGATITELQLSGLAPWPEQYYPVNDSTFS